MPIIKDKRIVGIVSRANLLQGLASLKDKAPQARADDSAIRDNVMKKLANERWARPALLSVTVQDGTVDLWGIVKSAAEKKAVHVLVEVTGCTTIHGRTTNVVSDVLASGSSVRGYLVDLVRRGKGIA